MRVVRIWTEKENSRKRWLERWDRKCTRNKVNTGMKKKQVTVK
jgi:hypothetical protein